MRGVTTSDCEESTSFYQLRPKRKREESSGPEDQPPSVMASTPSKKATSTSISSLDSQVDLNDGKFKTRSELVKSFDPIIESFGSADYETLMKLAEALFSKNVSLSCKLIPDPITNIVSDEFFDIDSYIIPDPPVQLENTFQQYTGIPSVLLLWMFLRETHPDSTMEVIDRRICYRQVIPNYLQLFNTNLTGTQHATMPTRSRRTNKATSTPADLLKTGQTPVSIVEMVVKLSGSCVTTRPLDAIFTNISNTQEVHSSDSVILDAEVDNEVAERKVNSLKRRISDVLVHQSNNEPLVSFDSFDNNINERTMSSQPIHHVVSANTAASMDSVEMYPHRALLGAPRAIHRKYLADIKLAYNEHDLITLFEFNLRAAEDFPDEL